VKGGYFEGGEGEAALSARRSERMGIFQEKQWKARLLHEVGRPLRGFAKGKKEKLSKSIVQRARSVTHEGKGSEEEGKASFSEKIKFPPSGGKNCSIVGKRWKGSQLGKGGKRERWVHALFHIGRSGVEIGKSF